jgi:CheY-like chemotaxis protein
MSTARRILVVDDSVDTVAMMKVLLKREGHEVRVAHDGPAALEVAAAYAPEVVLLDLTLPGLSGEEVAAALRKDESTASALIVAVSGYNDGVPPHFDHLLAKPVDHDALRRLLAPPLEGPASPDA